jgi:hypothetical protein
VLTDIGAQPLDADLTSLAAASAINVIYYRSAADTWSSVTIGTGLTFTSGTLAASATGNVSNSGTPVNGQLASWTDATHIQGITTLPAAAEPAHTGDVTNSAGSLALTIGPATVTYAKMQNVSATSRILGRLSAGAGSPEELTGTQSTTLLDVFTSALKGVVPASGGGTTNFLRADATWAAPSGGGGAGLSISDTPPASPTNGQLWWESDTGILWLYYTDPNTSQWVAVSSVPGATPGLVQHVYAEYVTYISGTTAMVGGTDTVPQQTDGVQYLTVSITPKSTSNKLNIKVIVPCICASTASAIWGAVFQDSTAAALVTTTLNVDTNPKSMVLNYEMTAGTISATTFKLRIGLFLVSAGATFYINGGTAGRYLGGSQRVTLTVTELAS